MAIIKPPVGAVLNRSHPLAKGLVGCWLMNEMGLYGFRDTITKSGVGVVVSTNPPNLIMSPEGPAVSFPYNRPGTYLDYGQNISHCPVNAMSVFARIYITSEGDNNNAIFSKGTDWLLKRYTGGSGGYSATMTTGGTARTIALASTNWGVGEVLSVGLTYDGVAVRLYAHGTQRGIVAGTGEIANTAATVIRCGGDSVIACVQQILSFMVYDRALTPAEIASMEQKPYAMFQRDQAVIWKAPAAGATVGSPILSGSILNSSILRCA
jgi:hypothetical protein